VIAPILGRGIRSCQLAVELGGTLGDDRRRLGAPVVILNFRAVGFASPSTLRPSSRQTVLWFE
jgi:hypothetical protein